VDATTLGPFAVRAFVVVTMASFGLQLSHGQLGAVLRRPLALLAVLTANLVLMPLAGIALAITLGLPEPVAVGVIITACSAGSTYSAKLVELARGDIQVGIGLMFLLATISAIALGPLAAAMLGLYGSATGMSVSLDPVPILASMVVFQLLPLLGLTELHRRAPRIAERLRRPAVRLSTVMLVAAAIAIVLESGDDLLRLGPVPLVAMVGLIGVGLVAGYVLGGTDDRRRRAAALVTGQRSASIAYIAVHGIDQPLATATVVAFALVMLAVNLAIAVGSGGVRARHPQGSPLGQEPASVGRAGRSVTG
jgi:BASS family bile acid:Na+ symporter